MHLSRRILAGMVDLSWLVAIAAFLVRIRGSSPVPSVTSLVVFLTAFALFIFICRKAFHGTLGEHLWRGSRTAPAFFVTLLTLVGAFWITRDTVWKHPLFARASSLSLPQVRIDSLPTSDYDVLSFFYSIGAWPKKYDGEPVHYVLPYEKGPPTQFLGRVQALWKNPGITVTFEGPKTPLDNEKPLDPALLQLCLASRWDSAPEAESGRTIADCIRVREAALARHITLIRRIRPTDWALAWFESGNPEIVPAERPRGFVLVGKSAMEAEEHWVLIGSKGVHQTIILSRPRSVAGLKAAQMLQASLATLRVFPALDAPRAWAGQKLARSQLRKAPMTPEEVLKLAEIEARLLSQISVQPKQLDAYFHFGGLMLTLLKAGQGQEVDGAHRARDNLYNTVRYAQDLAPSNPKTLELQDFLISIRR